ELNGIFFIPIASIMIGGFFFKRISAAGAKAALFTGLVFYVLCTFILKVDVHFIHIWGIEFLLNMAVMFGVSRFYPVRAMVAAQPASETTVPMDAWRYTKPFAIALVVITVVIYI